MKTVAVKFCGGCNPTYDRLAYWEKVKAAAARSMITWVGPDHPAPEAVLLICGCPTSCPEKDYRAFPPGRLLCVRDQRTAPDETAETILMRVCAFRTAYPNDAKRISCPRDAV